MTNCHNCGAPIDTELDKCPYCDTPYRKALLGSEYPTVYLDGTSVAKSVIRWGERLNRRIRMASWLWE